MLVSRKQFLLQHRRRPPVSEGVQQQALQLGQGREAMQPLRSQLPSEQRVSVLQVLQVERAIRDVLEGQLRLGASDLYRRVARLLGQHQGNGEVLIAILLDEQPFQ